MKGEKMNCPGCGRFMNLELMEVLNRIPFTSTLAPDISVMGWRCYNGECHYAFVNNGEMIPAPELDDKYAVIDDGGIHLIVGPV